ncbi:lysozyme g-like [Amblyraja radiata]|uniref:lysozyme g-like n=1 Tax=Amblyraja radiata TaxID=386614 RepID=UPI0014030D0E|nr:lysozyme g-like [Amblyraja radiata]
MTRYTTYGDITQVQTTGASQATANQDNLNYSGVAASQRLVKTDLERLNQYKSLIEDVADAKKIDVALIGAIMSRESRAGNCLDNGWGDHGNAYGLMQVDKRHHSIKGSWNSKEHVMQATQILIDMINAIGLKFPSWTSEKQLKGGISAYNMGPGNVPSYAEVDSHTTGKDYSNDVVARAQWLIDQGF